MEVHEALVTAGKRRLRPILMSSLTTIVGLIPMAAGFGGLSLSTVLTLVLIPTFYLIFDREDRNNRRMPAQNCPGSILGTVTGGE